MYYSQYSDVFFLSMIACYFVKVSFYDKLHKETSIENMLGGFALGMIFGKILYITGVIT